MHVLDNTTFEHSKFLKWAQIFYGLTFVFMCLAVLHFYDIHPRLGPLAISIARMMKETRDSLTSFKLFQRSVNPGTGFIHVFIHSWCISHSIWSCNNSIVVSKWDANLGKSWRSIFQTDSDSLWRAISVRIYNLWLQWSFEWMCRY